MWTCASVVACRIAFTGCRSCDNILDIGGATLDGPAEVEPGATNEFSVSGQIGKGTKCPATVQMSYVEVNSAGKVLNPKAASRSALQEIKNPPVSRSNNVCRLKAPVKVPLSISPGRGDQHRVKVTATLVGPAPKASDLPPENADPLLRLAKTFDLLSVGEETKIVTVKGAPPGTTVNQPPSADFIVSQQPAVDGQPLGLDARLSSDPDGSIALYEWDIDGNGSFDLSSSSPTGVRIETAAPPRQRITLRVTDNQGLQTLSRTTDVKSSTFGTAYTGGDPTLSPEVVAAGSPVTVGVKTTSVSRADKAELFCADTLTGGTLATPDTGESFPQRCTFSKPGFQRVAVRYTSDPGSSFPYEPTVFTRLVQVTPAARTAAARAPLSVRMRLSKASLKRLGKLRFAPTSATVRGLVATGTGRGTVPKGTPKRYRAAMNALASGRFAVKFSGSAKQVSTSITLSGSATLLVRGRKSRKTQVCLSVKAAAGGGDARFKVLGATGRARGFAGSGSGAPLTFDGDSGRSATIALTPHKGKARRLNRTCRSLARTLGR